MIERFTPRSEFLVADRCLFARILHVFNVLHSGKSQEGLAEYLTVVMIVVAHFRHSGQCARGLSTN